MFMLFGMMKGMATAISILIIQQMGERPGKLQTFGLTQETHRVRGVLLNLRSAAAGAMFMLFGLIIETVQWTSIGYDPRF
jgi:hypothetical protein